MPTDDPRPRELSVEDIKEMRETLHNAANDLLLNYLETQPRYDPILLDFTPCKNEYDTIHATIVSTPWMRLSLRSDIHIERYLFLMLNGRIISHARIIIAQHDLLNMGITQERLDYCATYLTASAECFLRAVYAKIDRSYLGVSLSRLPGWLYRRAVRSRIRCIDRDDYFVNQF